MAAQSLKSVSILHIITRLDRGGSAEVVLDLAYRLARDFSSVILISGKTVDPPDGLDRYEQRTGVRLLSLPELVRNPSPIRDMLAFVKLVRLIRKYKPDIVHTHTSKAGIIGRFAAFVAGVRTIVHTPHGHVFYGYYSRPVVMFFVLFERLAAHVTTVVTVLTERGKLDHLAMKIGTSAQYTVIPSGVDTRRFESGNGVRIRREMNWEDATIVGWAGRLVPVKDCATFIGAAARIAEAYPDARFCVAGNGELRAELESLASSLRLDGRIAFLGNRSDIQDIMASFDVFVLSSLNEGFGRVIVEAMSAGACVVATDVGGVADIITDGESGLLVPKSSPQALADAVGRVLDDEGLRELLKSGATVESRRFDVTETYIKYRSLYDSICRVDGDSGVSARHG